jgi:decaprenylphospho-beta-D-ribofuranose 2-oxidase
MGRSYGDAAMCAGGTVLDLTHRNRIIEFDRGTGVLVAEAGATLAQISARTHPLGWLPPVMPGTLHVSLGGAVATDVHGKNHVSAGSFGGHVRWLDVLAADLSIVRLSPHDRRKEFWATVGGMGLTGIILAVSLQCQRAGGTVLRHQQRLGSLSAVLDMLDDAAITQRCRSDLHTLAWLDPTGPRRAPIRGIVESAYVIGRGGSVSGGRAEPRQRLPSLPGPGVMGARTITALNAVRWRAAGDSRWMTGSLRSALQPLDRLEVWPAAFGRQGLLQCQVAVPEPERQLLARILETLRSFGLPPALTTIKRFGTASPAPMSFPIPGWTMAMDFPARWQAVQPALDQVEGMVAIAGGRVYLAKDSRLAPSSLALMYPRLGEWQEIRETMDPDHVFCSDLARRTGLAPSSTR